MAHFAEIVDGVVTRVIVFEGEGAEGEAACAAFMQRAEGLAESGTWKQTSYNGSIRGCFAGIGYSYDPEADEFVPPAE